MTTDNRTNEPTEAMVEAARRALNEHRALAHARCACGWPGVGNVTTSIGLGRHQAWAALEAAQGDAPRVDSDTQVACAVNHAGGVCPGYPHAASIQPSSTVDEAAKRGELT